MEDLAKVLELEPLFRCRFADANPGNIALADVLQAAGATPASAVKETTWVLDLEAWRQHGTPVRRDEMGSGTRFRGKMGF